MSKRRKPENNGLTRGGELHGSAKLTWKKVRQIRALCNAGANPALVASMYGVSRAAIWLIMHNRTWIETENVLATKSAAAKKRDMQVLRNALERITANDA